MIKQPSLPQYTKDGKIFPNSNFKTDAYYKTQNINDAKKIGGSVYTNAIRKANNSKLARLKKGHLFIQDIFREYWDDFKKVYSHLLTRKGVIDNVEKMIGCGDYNNGFLLFKCDNGCDEHIQPFSCKSRVCAKCGKKYRDLRTLKISEKLLDVPHRQFVFTIPEEYRYYFRKCRKLFKILFDSVNEAFNFIIPKPKGNSKDKLNKKKNRNLFGFISFLHTYGRGLNFNVHLHVLIAERYLTCDGKLINHFYFHFDQLRKAYMFTLTKKMYEAVKVSNKFTHKDLGEFYELNQKLIKTYADGFYIHGPKLKNHTLKSTKTITRYITRYASHPAISERRIISIDKQNHTITWFYDPHEDDDIKDEKLKKGRQYITEDIFDFMKKILIHIPGKYEHQIRYYGFYSNASKDVSSNSLFTTEELKTMKNNTYWIRGLITTFGYTPLICDVCGSRLHLSLNDSYFKKKGGFP